VGVIEGYVYMVMGYAYMVYIYGDGVCIYVGEGGDGRVRW
jgi:hypothetical protein